MECVKEKPKQKRRQNCGSSKNVPKPDKENEIFKDLSVNKNCDKNSERCEEPQPDLSKSTCCLLEEEINCLTISSKSEKFSDIKNEDISDNSVKNENLNVDHKNEKTVTENEQVVSLNKTLSINSNTETHKVTEIAPKHFDTILQINKRILSSIIKDDKIKENSPTLSVIRPYTENQLMSLYSNSELKAVDEFTTYFIEAELKGTLRQHYLFSLLENYLIVRNKLIGNIIEYEQQRNEYKESLNSLWSLESAVITRKAECLDGNIVTASHKYNKAIFHRSIFQTVCRILTSIRKLAAEDHIFYSYSAQVLKLQIDNYLQTLINNCTMIAQVSNTTSVSLKTENPPSEIIPHLNELRLCISVLFSFQRRLVKDSVFVEETRKWLTMTVALLLRIANWQDHIFILNHILRCPSGVSSWAANFIQAPLQESFNETPFSDLEINHIISVFSIIFRPIDKREQFLEQFSQNEDTTGENLWILVDSDGEEDESSVLPALKESDLVQIMNQIPLDNLFKRVLMIQSKDGKDYYDPSVLTEHHIVRYFAFSTTLINILRRGLITYNQPRYNQFSKRLCRLMRHIVQFATDQWEQFKTHQKLEDVSMVLRLQVEYDAFFLRATHCLYSSQKMGAWQFLAVVPYHLVSSKTLWKIYYLLHSCDTKEDVILDPTDPTDFKQKLWEESLRLEFEEKLNNMTDAESYYLLNTFTNMALARKDDDIDFVEAAVLDLLEVGFISEATSESCSKNARILLTYITSKYPQFLSNILEKIERNMNQVGQMSLYLYEELPLSIWRPSESDFVLISSWILHKTFTSDENRLSRMILSRLNWGFDDNDCLFLPHEVHFKTSLLIVQAIDKDEAWLPWAWKIILKLKLHYNDRGFSDFCSIPDMHNLDIVNKGVHLGKPFASLLSLLLTNWGHLVPLICTRGLFQLQTLINNQQYYISIFVLYLIVPLFVECQESLINLECFQNILVGLLNADRSYISMAKNLITPQGQILQQFGNMIHFHISNYQRYNLTTPKSLVRLWINSLVSVPGWNRDSGVLFLLDEIIKAAFFHSDALSVATNTLKDLLQASTPQEQSGTISSLFKWATLSNVPQGSLLTSASIPNCTFLAYVLIVIEYEERELHTGLWKEVLLQLYLQKGKVNIDSAIKRASSIKKVPSFTSSSLCIYRWAQQALDTPIDHPLLPLLWQYFFTLYLTRIQIPGNSSINICVGEKFFQGVINFNYLKRIKKRLQETVDYYKEKMDSFASNDEERSRNFFYENCFKIFNAFYLYLEEPRLQEANLSISELPQQYLPQYLTLIMQENTTPWIEFVNYYDIKALQEQCLQSWKKLLYREKSNYNRPTPNSRSGMESEDPIERILKRLNSFDQPKPPPELIISKLLVEPFNVENKETMFKFLEPYIKNLRQFSHNYVLKISEHKALDSSYKELVPQLYRSVLLKVKRQVSCNGITNNKSCAGAATIILEMQEARINERLDHQIQSNRKEYESILNRYFQEPSNNLCTASLIIQKTIEILQTQLQTNQCYSEIGVELFYYLVSLISEETNAFVPVRHLITTCLQSLGKTFILGVDYETPRILNKILEETSLGTLLSEYFSPINSSTVNFLFMYSILADNLMNKFEIIFGLLSKFDVNHWLTTKKPKISQRNQFLELVMNGLKKLGPEPSKEQLMVHELFRKHLMSIFEFQFPEHYGDVLTLLLKSSNQNADSTGCISTSVWIDVLNFLSKPLPMKTSGVIRDQLRQYAQAQHILSYQDLLDTMNLLKNHFSNERLQYGLYGLYPKYRHYIDVFVLFLGMIGHAFIVNAMTTHVGILGDKLCELLWPQLRDTFAPWITPYWLHNVKDNMPAWMQQLTDDRALLLPWIPADCNLAEKVTQTFFECLQFIIHTLPACNNILSFIWQWFVVNFCHSAVKDHVLNVIHKSLLALPWNNYWPSTGDLDLMLKVVDQYLPDCHVFLGYIFVEINWKEWLNVLVSNSPVQISMRVHQCLLNLLVKLSNEPRIRATRSDKMRDLLVYAEGFDWNFVDSQILQQTIDWYVMSCNPMVIFSKDQFDLDFRVLSLLKTVSHYNNNNQIFYQNNQQNVIEKKHIFVRSFIKLLSVLVNRNRDLVTTKQSNFKSMISAQLENLDANAKDNEEEIRIFVREYFGLFSINGMNQITLDSFQEWISKKCSDSVVIKIILENVACCVNDSEVVATLYEACIEAYFNNSGEYDLLYLLSFFKAFTSCALHFSFYAQIVGACVISFEHEFFENITKYILPNLKFLANYSSVISWNIISNYLVLFGPKQTELENILVQQGKILSLNAIIFQKIQNINNNHISLLNTLLQWLLEIKITSNNEDKIPLIWFQILSLCVKYSHNDEINISVVLHKFSQILTQISTDNKGVSGWGKGLLGAIGLIKGESISLKFKFLCKALAAFILAQLPDPKGDFPVIRKFNGAPCVIGHPGGNKECGKLLLNLEMGQSQGEIKYAAELALKQIQDSNYSLHNSGVFLSNLVTRLYTKPHFKNIENC